MRVGGALFPACIIDVVNWIGGEVCNGADWMEGWIDLLFYIHRS